MKRQIAESYLFLVGIDVLMCFGNLQFLHTLVRKSKLGKARVSTNDPVHDLCYAVDFACVFYPKTVHCLQRSAATTVLLRRYGIPAEMVIGAQTLPFKSHAWVEVAGAVVNDKPYVREIYQVLERC
jgi:hypothetical protein